MLLIGSKYLKINETIKISYFLKNNSEQNYLEKHCKTKEILESFI